jgi:hypothetical protein
LLKLARREAAHEPAFMRVLQLLQRCAIQGSNL